MKKRPLFAMICAGLVAMPLALAGCSTGDLLKQFNSGLLDSSGDPNHKPSDRHRALVKALIVHEVMDGYFTQGSPSGSAARWMAFAASEPHAFVRAVYLHAAYSGNDLGVAHAEVDDTPTAAAVPSSAAFRKGAAPKERFTALGAYFRRTPLPMGLPMCDAGKPNLAEAAELADALRFDAAVERAGTAVTALAIEGLVNLLDVEHGARDAFLELERYVGDRTWRRQFDRHVNGLVVKGGASTGLYSAGVVWVALNLIDHCLEDPACAAKTGDPRFTLISGTSTGAMVAVATDLFNSAKTTETRQAALGKLARWFTCTGSADLYCVRDGSALEMLRHQKGMMEFDGLESLLADNVTCDALRNPSELVLNTVDFRTGNLYDLSDQNELRRPVDVVHGALASAVLPFIAKPVTQLPVDYAPGVVEQTYLDGGIRSELPILPLVRRGAERVLVVSSSASVTGEMKNLPNGLSIATRYIDVSTGGVTESEIQHAERHVESVRLAEMDNCAHSPPVVSACTGDAPCVTAFCEGRWDDMCGSAPEDAEARDGNALDLTGQRLSSLWQMRSFFRNEEKTEALHGYNFDPVKQRQLFLAGAEDARTRCPEIAHLLGMPTTALGAKLVAWCAPMLPASETLCKDEPAHTTDLRTCKDPPRAASTEVCR